MSKKFKITSFFVFLLIVIIVSFINTDERIKLSKNVDNQPGKLENNLFIEKINNQEISYIFEEDIKEATVFSELLVYAQKNDVKVEYNNNHSFGVFIESIAGIKNGDDEKYWRYYVNTSLGEVSADKKKLKRGDTIKWRFEEMSF